VLSPDSIRKIRLDTALVVAGRRMAGQDDATIRREAPMAWSTSRRSDMRSGCW
jgi:hypothetical protein